MSKKERGGKNDFIRKWKNGVVVEVIKRSTVVVGPEGPDGPIGEFDKNGQPFVRPEETTIHDSTSGIDRSVPNGDR